MAKLPIKSFVPLSRRWYAVAAENVALQLVASVTRKATDLNAEVGGAKKDDIFWMRDPKTGNWIPETHFDQVDVAELRERLLPKKQKL